MKLKGAGCAPKLSFEWRGAPRPWLTVVGIVGNARNSHIEAICKLERIQWETLSWFERLSMRDKLLWPLLAR